MGTVALVLALMFAVLFGGSCLVVAFAWSAQMRYERDLRRSWDAVDVGAHMFAMDAQRFICRLIVSRQVAGGLEDEAFALQSRGAKFMTVRRESLEF